MKKLLSKSISAILLCSVLVSVNGNTITALANDEEYYEVEENMDIVSAEDWEETPAGEYPMDVLSPEWTEMSYSEAVAACDMPKEYAKSLTTEELVEYAVNYPFLIDILAFNSLEEGIEHMKQTSTVFEELFSRPDSSDKLLQEYAKLSCDYKCMEESEDMLESNYDEKMFLEAYFGLNYENLPKDQTDAFVDEYSEKYDEQPESIQDFSTSTIFYDGIMETMDYVPEDAIPDNVKEDMVLENTDNELSFTKTEPGLVSLSSGTKCYYGYHTIKGKKVYCYKYHSGDYTKATKRTLNTNFGKVHPTFVKLRSATKKYNCHSYAWYTTSSKNKLWINNPSAIFSNTNYFTKWKVPMANPGSGDKILFYSGSELLHSAILTSSNECRSKLGCYGVYKTTVSEMKTYYVAKSTQTYIKK